MERKTSFVNTGKSSSKNTSLLKINAQKYFQQMKSIKPNKNPHRYKKKFKKKYNNL